MLEIITKQNIDVFLILCCRHGEKKKIDANTENLTNTRKTKFSKRYDMFS
jgi:hypothetical protein